MLERGLAVAPAGVLLILFLPWVGRKFDQTFRKNPDGALRILGLLLLRPSTGPKSRAVSYTHLTLPTILLV